jgi:cytochrome c peroxidase
VSERWRCIAGVTLVSALALAACGQPDGVPGPIDAGDALPDAEADAGATADAGADSGCAFPDPPLAALPAAWPAPAVPADNPTSAAGVALGRRLFFDPGLSSTGLVACATCHDPAAAFSIPDALTSRGVSGLPLVRHAPALINLAWANTGLFWDGGSKNLESLALAPLTHPDEMGQTAGLGPVIAHLSADASYVAQFEHAFGADRLSASNLMRALAQYQRSLISDQSRWDLRQRGALAFEADEAAGEVVFTRHCARCHTPGLFSDGSFHNNGLDEEFGADPLDVRRGRGRVTNLDTDLGKFKTPTLRNIALSAPYMHDGRFATLDQVLAHYRFGMRHSATLDPGFLGLTDAPGVELSDVEAAKLLAFLQALTDPGFAARHPAPSVHEFALCDRPAP